MRILKESVMNREEALALADRGVEELIAALEKGKSERLLEYLAFQARFHRYSFGNTLLIAMQKPEATFVAGFHRWRELGRFVRKGEKGIMILAPIVKRKADELAEDTCEQSGTKKVVGFRATYVFDVSQTDGEEIPEVGAIRGEPGELIAMLRQQIADRGIELRYEEQLLGALGISEGGKIAILSGLPTAEEFAVLAHELAHELLHRTERRKETTKAIRELEAEAVAYVVCRASGLDGLDRSSDYIQLYQGDKEKLTASLGHIQRVASEMIDGLIALSESASSFAKSDAPAGCVTA